MADRDRIQAEARIVCGTTTRADVEWLAESNELLTAELDETRAALAEKEEALARAEAETERLREITDLLAEALTDHERWGEISSRGTGALTVYREALASRPGEEAAE